MAIMLVLFIIFLGIYTYNSFMLRDNLASNNLYDAMNSSLYYARDRSARTERGTFIINKRKFNDHFGNEHIKAFGNKTLSPSDYKISYIPDNRASKIRPKGSNYWNNHAALKAIRVRVAYNVRNNSRGNSKNEHNGHVATAVVEDQGTPSKYNDDLTQN